MSDETKTPPAPPEATPAPPPRRSPWKTALKWGGPVLVAILVGAVAGVAVASAIHMPRVESLANFKPGLITRMLDRDGDSFAQFSIERRVLLEESEIPELLTDALLASEDQNFMQHGGVDPLAILRAQIANVRAGDIEEGASTLTMQLARELFLTREKRWRRKIEEALLAVELEKNLSKEQILTLYMNQVNFGNGNYGAAAAAEDYFGKDVADLTIPEAATLVGVLPAPSRYNPYRNPEMAVERRNSVLRKMAEAGYITDPEADAARRQPLQLVRAIDRRRLGSYFAEDVRKILDDTYGTEAVVKGGLTIQTTMDPQIQRDAEEALRRGLVRLDHRRGWRGPVEHLDTPAAELARQTLPDWQGVDPIPGPWYRGLVLSSEGGEARVKIESAVFTLTRDGMSWTRKGNPGDILEAGDVAWFRLEGPADEEDDEAGTAADAPPSRDDDAPAVDPATLTLYLEQEPEMESAVVVIESATGAVRAMVGGFSFQRSKFNRASQAQRQVGSAFKPFVYGAALEAGYTPADTLFDAPTGFPGGDGRLSYRPRNYTRSFRGILTLRRALQQSINVPAVKLIDMVGVQRVIDLARRFGIQSELPPYPSLALGAAEITPLELAGAYAALANQGTWVEPYLIESAVTADGDLLEEHVPVTQSAMDPRTAYVLIHMMEGVIDRGTAVKLKNLPIDIAGKTGTTNDYTDAWFAGITPRYTILTWVGFDAKRKLGYGMTGSEAALPIWKDLAEAGLEHGWLEEGAEFPVPPGVTIKTIEYNSGLLPGPGAGRFIEEAFVEGTEPAQQFTPRWAGIMGLPWYQQRPFYIPKENERMPTGDTWTTDDRAEVGAFAEEG